MRAAVSFLFTPFRPSSAREIFKETAAILAREGVAMPVCFGESLDFEFSTGVWRGRTVNIIKKEELTYGDQRL